MVNECASETPAYRLYLKKELKKDFHINTEVKMIALKDLAAKQFAPHTSINHPRLWSVRMQDRAALQDLGTPPSRNSDPNGQIQPR
jgi:hypothetical protein